MVSQHSTLDSSTNLQITLQFLIHGYIQKHGTIDSSTISDNSSVSDGSVTNSIIPNCKWSLSQWFGDSVIINLKHWDSITTVHSSSTYRQLITGTINCINTIGSDRDGIDCIVTSVLTSCTTPIISSGVFNSGGLDMS